MGANHDTLREIVQDPLQELLEGEMSEALGASKNERADCRVGYATVQISTKRWALCFFLLATPPYAPRSLDAEQSSCKKSRQGCA
jgi:hypothetical protein